MTGLVCGVGKNDLQRKAASSSAFARGKCKIYQKWYDMIKRCYSITLQEKQKSYIGCSVCAEWLTFSNFKRWVESQDWENKEIDKDLLVKGNKIYSPQTCVFVDRITNQFTVDRKLDRGNYMLGVGWSISAGKFRARCSNPFERVRENLGYFDAELDAHIAWKKRKHELACKLADMQTDCRVAAALRVRYL